MTSKREGTGITWCSSEEVRKANNYKGNIKHLIHGREGNNVVYLKHFHDIHPRGWLIETFCVTSELLLTDFCVALLF